MIFDDWALTRQLKMDRGASQIEGTVCLKDLSWKKYGMFENGKDLSDEIRLEEWARTI